MKKLIPLKFSVLSIKIFITRVVVKIKISNTKERLKQIMNTRSIKQVDILNLTRPLCETYNIKLNKSDLSQYLSGKVEPNQHKLYILSEALDVSVVWLMGYDVPMEKLNINDEHVADSIIEHKYGKDFLEIAKLYTKLDNIDKKQIKDRLQCILKLKKYNTNSSFKKT